MHTHSLHTHTHTSSLPLSVTAHIRFSWSYTHTHLTRTNVFHRLGGRHVPPPARASPLISFLHSLYFFFHTVSLCWNSDGRVPESWGAISMSCFVYAYPGMHIKLVSLCFHACYVALCICFSYDVCIVYNFV